MRLDELTGQIEAGWIARTPSVNSGVLSAILDEFKPIPHYGFPLDHWFDIYEPSPQTHRASQHVLSRIWILAGARPPTSAFQYLNPQLASER